MRTRLPLPLQLSTSYLYTTCTYLYFFATRLRFNFFAFFLLFSFFLANSVKHLQPIIYLPNKNERPSLFAGLGPWELEEISFPDFDFHYTFKVCPNWIALLSPTAGKALPLHFYTLIYRPFLSSLSLSLSFSLSLSLSLFLTLFLSFFFTIRTYFAGHYFFTIFL